MGGLNKFEHHKESAHPPLTEAGVRLGGSPVRSAYMEDAGDQVDRGVKMMMIIIFGQILF